jgi:hypothetical protein
VIEISFMPSVSGCFSAWENKELNWHSVRFLALVVGRSDNVGV